jgi:hypothetical protein
MKVNFNSKRLWFMAYFVIRFWMRNSKKTVCYTSFFFRSRLSVIWVEVSNTVRSFELYGCVNVHNWVVSSLALDIHSLIHGPSFVHLSSSSFIFNFDYKLKIHKFNTKITVISKIITAFSSSSWSSSSNKQ